MPRPATPAAITRLQSAGLAPGASLRNAWQLPALIAALLLLVSGVITAVVTAPRPDAAKVFAQAEHLLETEDFPAVLEVLNGSLRPYYEQGLLSEDQERRFHILRARTVYLGERKAGIELEENARAVNGEYAEALRRSPAPPLEARDIYAWADANVTLGRTDRAIELAGQLPPSDRSGRGRVLKRIVERQLAAPRPDGEQILRLIAEFLRDAEVTPADRAWALARQSEFLLKQGQTEAAITKILQTLPSLLTEAPPDELGELYLLLGGAYAETGALPEAAKRLDQALKLLLPTDPRRAKALILTARVDEQVNPDPAEGKAEAKQKYTAVVEQFAASEARLPALLGLGEVEAGLGDAEASLRAYGELAAELAAGKGHPDLTIEGVTASLLDRARANLGTGNTGLAQRYAEVALGLHKAESAPPDLLLLLAKAHRTAAEAILTRDGTASGARRLVELAKLDAATRERARVHLMAAGENYRRHAEAVGIENNAGFGDSLWMAADCFDLAGDAERAIPLFADYARYFPGEPRQAEARYRLGQAQQARGDYTTAAEVYRALIADSARQAASAGPFADASYVPLAQCLLMNAEPGDDAEAEALLERVIQGGAGATSTPQFLAGLVELAGLKVRRGDHAGAIHHLEEAVARATDPERIDSLRYSLADAYRLDARAIRATLAHSMPDRQRQLLEETRLDRLRRAQAGFEEVRRSLDARDPRTLSKLESLQLRNSTFYLGDCAYDLRDFEAAIHHYDAAREKYPSDPASLVAMVQIVNAYVEQKDLTRARTANERAIRFYKSLPASVWADPDLPMTRDEWAAWLDSISALMNERAPGPASAGVPNP